MIAQNVFFLLVNKTNESLQVKNNERKNCNKYVHSIIEIGSMMPKGLFSIAAESKIKENKRITRTLPETARFEIKKFCGGKQ